MAKESYLFGKDCADGIVDADVTKGVEALSNGWGRGEVVGVAWYVFWASSLEGKRGSGLPMVLGSDFVLDSIAEGDCVTPEGENAFK